MVKALFAFIGFGLAALGVWFGDILVAVSVLSF